METIKTSTLPEIRSTPLLIDAERGHKSVSGFIKRGEVKLVQVRSFKEAERVIWEIESSKVKPSGIVFDTVTGFVARTILDVTKETPKQIWENRMTLQTTQQQWGIMSGIVIRLWEVARTFGIPLIFTAHEGERQDESTGTDRHFPDLNKMVRSDIVNNADAVLRVYRASTLFEVEGKRFQAGTLAVRTTPNEQYYAKLRVPDDLPNPPAVLGNTSATDWKPVVEQLLKYLGGSFESAVIYGAPGVGKTRLAVELVTALAK